MTDETTAPAVLYSEGAEQGFLCCVLRRGEILNEADLAKDAFYVPGNRLLFAACKRVYRSGGVLDNGAIDGVAVAKDLDERGEWATAGGVDKLTDTVTYVRDTLGYTALTTGWRQWADTIQDYAEQRGRFGVFQRLHEAAKAPGADLAALAESGVGELLDVAHGSTTGARHQTIGEVGTEALERFKARGEGKEIPVPVPWKGVRDALGGGLLPGSYVLVGATGSGKTQWALQVALHAALREDIPALYLSLEMDAEAVAARLWALYAHEKQWTGVDKKGRPLFPHRSDILRGRRVAHGGPRVGHLVDTGRTFAPLTDREWEDVERAATAVGKLPISVETASPYGFPADEIRSTALRFRRQHPDAPAWLLIVDYLQLLGAGERGQGRPDNIRERVATAAYQCRALAREENAVVLIISSAARSQYPVLAGRPPKNVEPIRQPHDPPTLVTGVGKESGEIEYSANGLFVLMHPPGADVQDANARWLALAKQRDDEPAWCPLTFERGEVFGCALGQKWTTPPTREETGAAKKGPEKTAGKTPAATTNATNEDSARAERIHKAEKELFPQ